MKENSTITLYRFSFNLKFWTQSNETQNNEIIKLTD